MVDWSIILCANNHKTGNGTGTGRRTVTPLQTDSLAAEWIIGLILNLSTILLATKSPARHPVSSRASTLMLPFASSWETNVSTTGSRLGEVAIWSLIGKIVLTYVPLLFQSLDGLFVLEAHEVEPEDFPVLFISPWSSLKFGIQSLSPVALTNRPWASEPT